MRWFRKTNVIYVPDKIEIEKCCELFFKLSQFYVLGLLVGAFISKNIASFLEENDLFIPDDEDDD